MKTITGKEAYRLLMEAEAYIIYDGNRGLCYGMPEEVFDGEEYELNLSYDSEGQRWEYIFLWGDSDEMRVEDNKIFMVHNETGDEIGIELLVTKEL